MTLKKFVLVNSSVKIVTLDFNFVRVCSLTTKDQAVTIKCHSFVCSIETDGVSENRPGPGIALELCHPLMVLIGSISIAAKEEVAVLL